MSVDLRCTNCEDNLGKDVENSQPAWCGTCGSYVYNERGDTEGQTPAEKEWLKANKPKYRTGSLIRKR